MIAYRSAADYDDAIGRRDSIASNICERIEIIPLLNLLNKNSAAAFRQGGDAVTAGFRDGMGRAVGRAGLGQLTAGSDDHDTRLADQFHFCDIGTCQRDHGACGKPLPLLQQRITRCEIAGPIANVAPRAKAGRKTDVILLPLRIFLHDDAVCTVGNMCSGRDSHGLPRSQATLVWQACSRLPRYSQPLTWRRIVHSHSVSIHRRHVGARGIDGSEYRLCQIAPGGFLNLDGVSGKSAYRSQ